MEYAFFEIPLDLNPNIIRIRPLRLLCICARPRLPPPHHHPPVPVRFPTNRSALETLGRFLSAAVDI